jgi:hypothetical protein
LRCGSAAGVGACVDVEEGWAVGVGVAGYRDWDGGVAVFYSGEHFFPEFPGVRHVSIEFGVGVVCLGLCASTPPRSQLTLAFFSALLRRERFVWGSFDRTLLLGVRHIVLC